MSGAITEEHVSLELEKTVSEIKKAAQTPRITKEEVNALARRCLDLLKTFDLENKDSGADVLLSLSNLKSFNYLCKFVSAVCLYSGLVAHQMPVVDRVDPELVNLCEICDGALRDEAFKAILEILAREDHTSRALAILPTIADCIYVLSILQLQRFLPKYLELLPTQILYETFLSVLHWTRKPKLQAFFSAQLTKVLMFRDDAIVSLLSNYANHSEGEFVEVSSTQLDEIAKVFIVVPSGVTPRDYYEKIAKQNNKILANPTSPQKVVDLLLAVLARVEVLKPSALKEQRDLLVMSFESVGYPHCIQSKFYLLSRLVQFDFPFAVHVYLRCLPVLWACYVLLKAENCDVALFEEIFNSTVAQKRECLEKLIQVLNSPSYLLPKLNRTDEGSDLELKFPENVGYERSTYTGQQTRFMFELIAQFKEEPTTIVVSYILEQLLRGCDFNQERAQTYQDLLIMLFDETDHILKANLGKSLQIIGTVIKRVLTESGERLSKEENLELETCFNLTRQFIEQAAIKLGKDEIIDTSSLKKLLPYCANRELPTKRIKELIALGADVNNDFGGEAKEGDSAATVLGIAKQSIASPFVPIKAYGVSLLKKLVYNSEATEYEKDTAIDLLVSQLCEEDAFVHVAARVALKDLVHETTPKWVSKLKDLAITENAAQMRTNGPARATELINSIRQGVKAEIKTEGVAPPE